MGLAKEHPEPSVVAAFPIKPLGSRPTIQLKLVPPHG